MKELGTRLKILREGTGLSQAKFAEVIGSTQSSINRMRMDRQCHQWNFCADMRTILMSLWTTYLPAATARRTSCIKRRRPGTTRNLQNLSRCTLTQARR